MPRLRQRVRNDRPHGRECRRAPRFGRLRPRAVRPRGVGPMRRSVVCRTRRRALCDADVQPRRLGGRDVRQRHTLRGAPRRRTLSARREFHAAPACRAERIAPEIPTYGVDIEVRTSSDDFGFARGAGRFVAEVIPSLESPLRFTALNLGNPHIVAEVERIDMRELERMGEAVARLGKDFPHGINVSMYERRGPQSLFAATFERGAGITYSCGTAMTACSTAATLTGACREGEPIEVYNRGGMVRCLCRAGGGRIVTRLRHRGGDPHREPRRRDGRIRPLRTEYQRTIIR